MDYNGIYWDLRKMAERLAILAYRRLPNRKRALETLETARECEQFALELWYRGYGD